MSYPDKHRIAELAEMLGRRYQERFPTYEFLKLGSVYAPSVRDVTDMDICLNSSEPGLVSTEEFDELEMVASELFGLNKKAMIARNEEVVFRGANLSVARDVVAEGAMVVLFKGQLEVTGGWHVPTEISLRKGGGVLWTSTCIKSIRLMLEQKRYDIVISRMRRLLPEDREGLFNARWNDAGGRMRFIVKQLEQLQYMHDWQASLYMEETLKLPGELGNHSEWMAVAAAEMKRIALDFLLQQQALYADILWRLAPDILASIGVAREADVIAS